MNKYLTIAILTLLSCTKETPFVLPDIEEQPVLCEQNSCWDPSIYACTDSTYNSLFTRFTGWTGGDATYSVDLQNGKTLWMFGDSFIDQVSEDRSRPSFKLINNALVLQDNQELTTYQGGTSISPAAFATPQEEGQWYWPGDGTIANEKLLLFMHGFGTGGGGMWDFFRTSIDLLTINRETLKVEGSQRLFADPAISWGAAIMETDDFTYVYGVRAVNPDKFLYVARTDSDLSKQWEFYDGSNWVTDSSQAAEIFDGVSEQFSVWEDAGTFYLLTQHNLFGSEISIYDSSEPEGIFENGRVVYCTPETGGDIFTYNAFAHTQAYSDSLLVSYNINSFNINDLLKSADNYRPYFVRIGGWRKTN